MGLSKFHAHSISKQMLVRKTIKHSCKRAQVIILFRSPNRVVNSTLSVKNAYAIFRRLY
jgi:hypothetical protein